MKILYISVIEQNAGWGAEYFVNRGFIKNGHKTITLDYRKYRDQLGEKLLQVGDFDVLLLQRGDWFPIELLKAVNRPKFFWASEPIVSCRDEDRLLTSGKFEHIFVHTNRCLNFAVEDYKWLSRSNTSVLVNGFDEMMQYKMPSTLKDIDVLFVGTPSKRREKIIQILEKNLI